jgi:CheY-like chemotaxis protein/DNA-binding CsgD family transcriptional regulator
MNNYKILIVDDVIENIQTLTDYLELLHPEYRLYQATQGQMAFEIAKTMKIDLIISDWDMPGMSGIELVKLLKTDSRTAHIPVIIVTGVMLSTSDLESALTAGAHDYLRKPVDPVELAARTHSAICYVSIHMKELAAKNLELTEKTMLLTRNNQFNIEIAKKLKQLESHLDGNSGAKIVIREILYDIAQKTREDDWGHFEVAFQNVHPEFSKNLIQKYPFISPGELRQCILIRLGLNNKDIASVLYLSPDSIKVSRSRIRKKLQIENDKNLQTFLAMI